MKSRVRASAVIVHNGKLLTMKAIDPNDGREFNFLPGGSIEADETAPDAAERETMEETGFSVAIQPESCIDKEYIFHWNGEDYDCLTMFYRGSLRSPLQKKISDASYNQGAEWIPVSEIKKVFSYSREILEAIEELILP